MRTPLFIAFLALSACDRGQVVTGNSQALVGKARPIDGYGGYKLGATFEAVLPMVDPDRFNASSLRDCLDDLAIKGCLLIEDDERPATERRDGIPYHLQLSFNPHDRLTDIDLVFDRDQGVSAQACLDLAGRTYDWLTTDYGPFAPSPVNGRIKGEAKTAGGNMLPLFEPLRNGEFHAALTRNVGDTTPQQRRGSIVDWDRNRYVALFGIYLKELHSCRVDVQFSEPLLVERRTQKTLTGE